MKRTITRYVTFALYEQEVFNSLNEITRTDISFEHLRLFSYSVIVIAIGDLTCC